MKKKIMSMIALTAMCTVLFIGCAPKHEVPPPPPPEAPAPPPPPPPSK